MIFEEKTLSKEVIYEGKVLNLRVEQVTAPKGTATRELIYHRGAVALIPIKDDGKVVLVRQFRKAAEKVLLEIPAGKLEGDEDPMEAAVRELKEETGYTAESIEHLTSFYPAIGYSCERIHLYACRGLTAGETDFDDDEAIEIEEYSPAEMMRMVQSGEIEDGKTIIAAYYVNR